MKFKITILLVSLALGLVLTGCATNGTNGSQQAPAHNHSH